VINPGQPREAAFFDARSSSKLHPDEFIGGFDVLAIAFGHLAVIKATEVMVQED
jgi:hypothetical protein